MLVIERFWNGGGPTLTLVWRNESNIRAFRSPLHSKIGYISFQKLVPTLNLVFGNQAIFKVVGGA